MEYRGINLADNINLYKKDGSYNKMVKNSLDSLIDLLNENDHELLSEYKNAHTKVKIDFKCGHIPHDIIPHAYKNGNRCPKCRGNCPKQAQEDLISLMESNGHNWVDGEYIDAQTKILINYQCGHDPNWVSPNKYKNGQGCPKCISKNRSGKNRSGNKSNNTESIEQAKEYLISLLEFNGHEWVGGEYVNRDTKILIDYKCDHPPHPIRPANYKKGNGCPLCKESKGEKRVRKWLEENKFTYKAQKEFTGLIGINGGLLSYDFYLPSQNLLIEYQGEMHERFVKGIHNSIEDFHKQQEHDKRKREYAELHNIKLLEIWYWDFNRIEEILENKLITPQHTNYNTLQRIRTNKIHIE